MLLWLFNGLYIHFKQMNRRVFLHLLAAICLSSLSLNVFAKPNPLLPKLNCQPWLNELSPRLTLKQKIRMEGSWQTYQYLCFGETKCVAFLDQLSSHLVHSELKSDWEKELKDFKFEKRGGRILWNLDAGGMNCHAYACFRAGIPGIETNMTISPTNNPALKNAPFSKFLEAFFDLLPMKPIGRLRFDEWLAQNAEDGDLLLYYADDEIIHSGIVNVRKDAHGVHYVIESKLGNGPVVEASAELTYDYYEEATSVRLARVKEKAFAH